MTATLLTRNGHAPVTPAEAPVHRNGDHESNGLHARLAEGPPAAPAEAVNTNGAPAADDGRPVLAAFCFEPPGSLIGEHARRLAAALARRQTTVHLFARHAFDAPGAHVHALGEAPGDDLLDQVQAFGSQACNAFLRLFPAARAGVTLMGFEWSAAGVLSMLRGLKNLKTILSLHSLERQRSDLSGELSRRIEEVELTALREAATVLVEEPAAGAVAGQLVPGCASRLVSPRPTFPAHRFETSLDPADVKARYQVGPVDPTILYVGDLSERYGADVLLKAMPAVLKNHGQARLVVVGHGDLYWPLRVYTRYLLLEHAVRLVGNVEGRALEELVRAADVVAVPSREATPWWPVQAAWAAGRPVVATHAAAPGLLEHEQDAVLCYPSPNSLVWGLERVLFDPELGKAIADRGRQKLDRRFGWNVRAEQVEELMGVPAST
jgi:glycosyltransferase involved in cell wall biosynthesis